MNQSLRNFYDKEYQAEQYASAIEADEHAFYHDLTAFVIENNLQDKRCLEIGCGRGAFQDIVEDYTGIDISHAAGRYLRKPFSQASATEIPFPDNSFDAIWSYAVVEHIPQPEKALKEMRRVLVDGGLLLLAPAWQCRPWAADGYAVRPYGDFNLRGKLIKASIPVRDSIWFRATALVPRRFVRLIRFWITQNEVPFKYKELTPNYEYFWTSDSDAVNSMDPFDAILWFASRGDKCLNYPTWLSKFKIRTGSLVLQVCKSGQYGLD